MATTKAITANAYKNNGGTVLGAGNVNTSTNPITKVVSVKDNAIFDGYGTKVIKAVSPNSSGNLGTVACFTNGTFNYQNQARTFLIKGYCSTINGTANDSLKFSASDKGFRRPIHFLERSRRLDEDSWDYETGDVTKGGQEGALVSYSADHAARPTDSVPGELTYKTGKLAPINDDYKPRFS